MNSKHLSLPRGAHQIEQARRRGFKPTGAVIVSFVGLTPWQGHHVHCESGKRYDWSWSEDLELVIVVTPEVDAWGAICGCFWPANARCFTTVIDIKNKLVSYVIALVPEPLLWHLRDVSGYFPEAA